MRIVKCILVSRSDEGDAKSDRAARGWTRDAWTTPQCFWTTNDER